MNAAHHNNLIDRFVQQLTTYPRVLAALGLLMLVTLGAIGSHLQLSKYKRRGTNDKRCRMRADLSALCRSLGSVSPAYPHACSLINNKQDCSFHTLESSRTALKLWNGTCHEWWAELRSGSSHDSRTEDETLDETLLRNTTQRPTISEHHGTGRRLTRPLFLGHCMHIHRKENPS